MWSVTTLFVGGAFGDLHMSIWNGSWWVHVDCPWLPALSLKFHFDIWTVYLTIGLKSGSLCKFQLGLDDYMIITGDNWLFHQAFKDSLFVVPLAALPIVGSSGAQLLRIESSSWVAKVLGAMAGRVASRWEKAMPTPTKEVLPFDWSLLCIFFVP